MRIVFCVYRDWALNVAKRVLKNNTTHKIKVIESNEDFINSSQSIVDNSDLLVFIGWSWIIPSSITENILCLGMHPSDLPLYRGGSPLQHQIINGVIDTKISLITLSEKLDAGDIWMKEPISFLGDNMNQILRRLEDSTVNLIEGFISVYPNISPVKQTISEGTYYSRRKPSDGRLLPDDFREKSLKELHNFMRCLTNPYPNSFLEDEFGNRLYFESVRFEEGNKI